MTHGVNCLDCLQKCLFHGCDRSCCVMRDLAVIIFRLNNNFWKFRGPKKLLCCFEYITVVAEWSFYCRTAYTFRTGYSSGSCINSL